MSSDNVNAGTTLEDFVSLLFSIFKYYRYTLFDLVSHEIHGMDVTQTKSLNF